jgi:pimeloyl-ACP methyl ester carboxylesterase
LLFLVVPMLYGCTYLELLAHTYSSSALPAQHFRFRDGGEAIFFTTDIREETSRGEPVTYAFVLSGSDCTSMKYFLPQYLRGLDGISGPVRVFALHKRFIGERTWGRISGCSEAFIDADHPSQWIADYTEMIETELAQRRPGRVVLVGVSEGGDVVPLLARRIKMVTHVALLANGGMDPLEAFRLQATKHVIPGAKETLLSLDAGVPRDAAGNPDDQRRIGGRTWRYWSELRELEPTDNLLALDIPVMVAMGEDDESLSVEAAQRLQDRFQQRGKSNLTLVTYQGADHGLFDREERRSRLPDFWHRFDLWLAESRKSN